MAVGADPVIVIEAEPEPLVAPALFTSTHESARVPGEPAVNVIVFVDPLVTPATPPVLVIEPPLIVHT